MAKPQSPSMLSSPSGLVARLITLLQVLAQSQELNEKNIVLELLRAADLAVAAALWNRDVF